ncbi:hypothetical protein ACFFJ0_13840, partial [Sphingobium scionense]
GETVNDIPVRMRQTRMRTQQRESRTGLLCQAETTRNKRLHKDGSRSYEQVNLKFFHSLSPRRIFLF